MCTVLVLLFLAACQSPKNEANAGVKHSAHQHASDASTPSKTLSPRRQAMTNIGDVHIHIDYSSPSKRGRTIWNGLVAYGQVWVTGAHSATSIDFSNDVIFAGQTIPKGKYAFFTIPDAGEWTIILNKNYQQHLADDYDEKLDVVRVKVKPEPLDESIESLTFQVVTEKEGAGFVSVAWDTVQVRLPIEVR